VSTQLPNPGAIAAELALGSLALHGELIASLAEAFKREGFTLALVGGPCVMPYWADLEMI